MPAPDEAASTELGPILHVQCIDERAGNAPLYRITSAYRPPSSTGIHLASAHSANPFVP